MLDKLKYLSILQKAVKNAGKSYTVSFTKEKDNCWYVDFPNWPLDHYNLMMVAGADDMLDLLDNGKNHVTVKVICSNKPLEEDGIRLINIHQGITQGATYNVENMPNWHAGKTIWLCPVTLCVLGRYPKYMYFKKVS